MNVALVKQIGLVSRAIVLAVIVSSCGKSVPEKPREPLLARIGDRTISTDEFIRRAEYTPRPNYCSGDNPVHKKIVLNSLIAEKLLAFEAGDTAALARSRWFHLFLEGRKEQAVRDWLYRLSFYRKVKIGKSELRRALKAIGRTYRVQYITADDSASIALLYEARQRTLPLDTVARRLHRIGRLPERKIGWVPSEPQAVLDSLFLQPVRRGQLVGPIRTPDGSAVLLHVVGWRDRVVVGSTAQQQRVFDAEARLRESKASAAYRQWVAELMRGKRLRLYPRAFRSLVRILEPVYLTSSSQIKAGIQQTVFGTPADSNVAKELDRGLRGLANRPVLEIDGQVWTGTRLREEMLKHPLVFRRKWISPRDFPRQLRLALADLVRDRFVTDVALERGYGRLAPVKREVAMWRDALLAAYRRDCLLSQLGLADAFATNPEAVVDTVLTPYVHSLFQKYSKQIEIDVEAFNRLQLTRVPLFAFRPNAPFRVVVPPFPVLTSQHRLDYGRKLRKNKPQAPTGAESSAACFPEFQ